ncbi:DUF6262 family protein [Bacillus paranthracis]|uniref:DUF6262 family protein n=1 Tax=Bacillus cereus group TaxID=86661 RepID=UPI000A3B2F51|nr:DUF6262 family protein [Bacillus paranthracis]MCR6791547.1 DUF6262 family protein [Bacillus paranthracis]MED1169546.1 DUF6262 family protein [Bacillus paranthracis]
MNESMAYNLSLQEYHQQLRNNSIEELKKGIDVIRGFEGENTVITAKKLMENTSLSRPVLYKEHILKEWNYELWETRMLKKKARAVNLSKYNNDIKNLKDEIKIFSDELKKARNTITIMNNKIEKERKRSEVYKMDIEELKEEKQKILAECQRLNDKLVMHGIQ